MMKSWKRIENPDISETDGKNTFIRYILKTVIFVSLNFLWIASPVNGQPEKQETMIKSEEIWGPSRKARHELLHGISIRDSRAHGVVLLTPLMFVSNRARTGFPFLLLFFFKGIRLLINSIENFHLLITWPNRLNIQLLNLPRQFARQTEQTFRRLNKHQTRWGGSYLATYVNRKPNMLLSDHWLNYFS